MTDKEAMEFLIKQAIATPECQLRLATAEELLMGEVERNKFNTERAIEIYTFAIDHCVWGWVKTSSVTKLMYEPYVRSGSGRDMASNSRRRLR